MKDLFTLLIITISFILQLINPQISSEKKFKLLVKFNNIQKKDKPVYIALYGSEKDFDKRNAFKYYSILPSVKNSIVIKNLPEGDYAILCFQDFNNNRFLDYKNYRPNEPWGVSNNHIHRGPPMWTDATFKLNRNLDMDIKLFY